MGSICTARSVCWVSDVNTKAQTPTTLHLPFADALGSMFTGWALRATSKSAAVTLAPVAQQWPRQGLKKGQSTLEERGGASFG